MQDRDKQDARRAGEVEQLPDPRIGEDPGGFTQIACDDRGLRVGGKQRTSVGEHDGVVVHVDGPGIRRHRPGDLVDVFLRRQASANIQELPDALAGDMTNRTAEKRPTEGPCPVG